MSDEKKECFCDDALRAGALLNRVLALRSLRVSYGDVETQDLLRDIRAFLEPPAVPDARRTVDATPLRVWTDNQTPAEDEPN